MPPMKANGKKASTTDWRGKAADKEELLAALRQFIRTKGEDYLRDPNLLDRN